MKSIDIMFPVYLGNLHEIEPCVKASYPHFERTLKEYDWKIIFAINGKTPEPIIQLIQELQTDFPRIGYDHTPEPGKGSGVIHSWSQSKANIVTYMDVDLATDIGNFHQLIKNVEMGADLSIGSRYHPDSDVQRSLKRKVVSIIYHRMFMKLVLRAKSYTDAQCGYKAVNQKVIHEILPLIKNKSWFFESELLYIAQRKGMIIKEVPVKWKESRFSGITLYKAIWEFLRSSFAIIFRKF